MARAEVAQDDPCRKQRKADDGHEENHVSQIQHALLEILKMGIDAESGHGIDQPVGRPTGDQVGHGRKSGQQQEQANHHRDDEADDLVSRHGGGQTAYRALWDTRTSR